MKELKSVLIKFKNSKYNYTTSISANATLKSASKYFIGQSFDVGTYAKENIQKCIGIQLLKH